MPRRVRQNPFGVAAGGSKEMGNGTNSLSQRLRRLGYASYAAYLSSPHWQDVRKRYYASGLYRGCCHGCGATNVPLEIHHRTYKRFGKEWLMDLMPLCRGCHQASHDMERRGYQLWQATSRGIGKRKKKLAKK